jgi:rhodanese-related sulfurtransferase
VTLVDVRPTEEYAAGHVPGHPRDELCERLAIGRIDHQLTEMPVVRSPQLILDDDESVVTVFREDIGAKRP